jgi:hypothetical protein
MHQLASSSITFETVRAFCHEDHEEGMDLDYKADWPSDLAKVLCAVAHVQDSLVMVSVGPRPGTHRPAWPPPGVTRTEVALHWGPIQVAHGGIYPPVLPQVEVCPLDTGSFTAVVVIRVGAGPQTIAGNAHLTMRATTGLGAEVGRRGGRPRCRVRGQSGVLTRLLNSPGCKRVPCLQSIHFKVT